MRVINYCWTHKFNNYIHPISKTSHFSIDGVSFPLEKYKNIIDDNYIYTKCPVWQHKSNRTFVVRSPISYEIQFQKNENGGYLIFWDYDKNSLPFDEVVKLDEGWNICETAVIQISHPTLAMWTKDKNIWYEVRPHAPTTAKNNFYAIGGWFNLSAWTRPSAFGIHVYDMEKPVKVNRGDILFEVCFYSANLNDKFKLVEHDEIPEKEWQRMINTMNVKRIIRNFTTHLFAEQKESKCPFRFLSKDK